jgi:MFS transporter, MHS family, shikimate and dehydroshikimate transport protein
MERLGGEDAGQSASIGRVALASFVGTAIEGYDFFIYGIAAALVFGQLFFPNEDPLIGTLAAFATFAVGFVARPVGGVVFGHFGDKVGRKPMLVITILTMGLATFLIGLLPTYAQIGIWAPILLVALHLIQCFSVGGEWGGAALMTVEHAPEGRRGYYGSWTTAAAAAGVMLATGVFAAFSGLSDEQFLAWGWRVPFLLSIFLVGVGVFIRLKILESPTFARLKETGVQARIDDDLHTLDRARLRLRDPGPYRYRAGRPGRRQLNEANLVADPVVVVRVEAGLVGVEGLRPVHVRYGYRHQFDLPIHCTPSLHMVVQRAPVRASHC